MIHWIIDFFIILLAVLTADGLIIVWQKWRDKKLDINCDNCEQVAPLAKTPDKKFYLCKVCMDAYLMEHVEKFTEEQTLKAKRVFRKLKRKK